VPYSLEEHRCGYLSLIGFDPVDRYTTEYVTYKQGDARPTAIFPATPHHNHFTALFLGPENFWTLWCNGRLTVADTQTIRLSATPSGLTSAHLHHPHSFYRPYALPAAQPTVSKH